MRAIPGSCLVLILSCFLHSPVYAWRSSVNWQHDVAGQQNRRRLITSFLTSTLWLPIPSLALSPEDAAKQYDSYAATYDSLDGGQASSALGIDQARRDLIGQAAGHVLEIGVGTGLNLDKYQRERLSSLTVVDISPGMLQEATNRVQSLDNLHGLAVKTRVVDASNGLVDAFGTEAFDTVIDSFSLCVMGNQGARSCLDQLSRVVKPSGRVLLLENSRSTNPLLAAYQDVTAEAAAGVGGKGCVYNQDVAGMIQSTGRLAIEQETRYAAGLFRSFVCRRTNKDSNILE